MLTSRLLIKLERKKLLKCFIIKQIDYIDRIREMMDFFAEICSSRAIQILGIESQYKDANFCMEPTLLKSHLKRNQLCVPISR